MTTPTETELAEMEARCEAATKGPWQWSINRKCHQMYLETTHSGRIYVMGFVRWGMTSAAALFGGSSFMRRADELAADIPGQEHNNAWNQTIDHPDASFIAHARTDLPRLIEYVRALRTQLATRTAERDAACAEAATLAGLLNRRPREGES